MKKLGLAPPYSREDIKQAYYERARHAHPDAGGNMRQFVELQEAYEQALEYIEFRTSRRNWIAARMDRYLELQEVVADLRDLGAVVQVAAARGLEESLGEFAQIDEAVQEIALCDSPHGDALIEQLLAQRRLLRTLKALNLAGSTVSDEMVLRLELLDGLRHLDLSRTGITSRCAQLAKLMPHLLSFRVDDTRIGWWRKRRIAIQLSHHQEARPLLAQYMQHQQES